MSAVTPALISVSRRTDIPAFYADWFFHRIREGFAEVHNPMRYSQIKRVALTPESVAGIVFWTKNPLPMLPHLDKLKDFTYYFQFTLTPYGQDIEPNLPDKFTLLADTFRRLSQKLGPERVIWRYDPILINDTYTADFHLEAFAALAKRLGEHTRRVVISFIDTHYRNVKVQQKYLRLCEITEEMKKALAAGLVRAAAEYNLPIYACAEQTDLREWGILPAACVDAGLLDTLRGQCLPIIKATGQRPDCGCAASTDIGAYNTCDHGCRYCYANYHARAIAAYLKAHDATAPALH